MSKYLVICACLGFLLLSGCNRCAMWDWYCPCDLIEGKDQDPAWNCGPCGPARGQVVKREWAVPASRCTPVPHQAMTEAPPAPLPQPAVVDVAVPPAGE